MKKKMMLTGFIAALLAGATLYAVQEAPKQCALTQEKEHQWLQRFVGEWVSETEAIAPGQPAFTTTGTETVRSIGGIWVIAENTSPTPMGMPMTGLLTIGYNPQEKKFVGTWIDSMTSHLWTYEGSLDPAGRILTLEAEGPSFVDPAKTCRYRDAIELKSDDHKVLTSSVLGDDGEWQRFVTVNYRRKTS